ncbi:SDR family NAD(P)-dependent oxidoreductase [Gordonia sp. DT218]|uniref:SDR family NAD(P)-dependent oxidoreductase n=1 Tax=Gordonia sp. DT218 TaxID=3416659 RepID=UPI003CED166B
MRPDTSRPVAVVTGASSGIGRSTARKLVGLGWHVIGVGRDPVRSAAAEAEITASARDGSGFIMLRGDFTVMSDVTRVADEIAESTSGIDVLINNAGGIRDRLIVTAEGTEATFAANHLAPFLLTRELMPQLRTRAAEVPASSVRVLAVSSTAHRSSRGLDWTDLQGLHKARYGSHYLDAKLANLLFTRELARRAAPDGIVAQAMHPGVVASNFASHADEVMQAHMAAADTVSPDEPADTLVWLATASEGGRHGGRYFHRMAEETPGGAAVDDTAAARLWEESEKLLASLGY